MTTQAKRKPANYIDKLNRLHSLRAKAGKDLHTRVKLAHEIYTDPDYRDKMANDHSTTAEAISPDNLALAIDNTWPDLIAIGYSWTGSQTDANGCQCGCLQTIYQKFPDKQDWINNHLPSLWEQCATTREKSIITRRCATLKDLKDRDDEIKRLNRIIERLKLANTKLQAEIDQLQAKINDLTGENSNLRKTLAQSNQYIT